jgi:hypothetical protein
MYRARVQALLENWEHLAPTKGTPIPSIEFFRPELSADERIASLPLRMEGVTLGSRSLLQEAARDLYVFLPIAFKLDVEMGVTEPSAQGGGSRHDWWNPHQSIPGPSEEILSEIRRGGGTVVGAADLEKALKPRGGK